MGKKTVQKQKRRQTKNKQKDNNSPQFKIVYYKVELNFTSMSKKK